MQWAYTLTVLACVAVAVIAQDTQPQPGVGGGRRRGRGNVCKYNRKTKECGECDTVTNTTTCTLQLKKGPDTCAATKTMTINRCIVPGEGGRKRGRGKGRGGKPCKYMKPAWGDCNPETNTMSRTLTLKKGDDTCEPTKVVTKRCRRSARQAKACKYQKGAWSSCAGDATE
ncbi:unnamed protein product, partial [Owenia fusiformis]